ncbi:MAG: ADP-ribosylglycohydrolase family protein [Armatimonadota bacterium]
MRRLISALAVTASLAIGVVSAAEAGRSTGPHRISRAELEDRVRGGWAGQMIGVSFGAPTEFHYLGRTIEGELSWSPDRVTNAIQQDDLYVEMTFAEVMDRIGLDATTEQYGEAFKNSKYNLWHANAGARRLLNQGIKAPWSGHPKYNIHANDIDFQIEADFIGLMTPGLPRESNKYCDRVGRVMNYGDGLYGGMFVCGMYAVGYFETDVRRVVEQGVACLPRESGYAQIIRDVLQWSREHPDDWRKTWQLVQDKWDRDDSCTGGALQPFNIDARLNGAYIAIGILYGNGDWEKTLEITTRCGQDSDCNPASALGVLGVMRGYRAIPEKWKSGIPAIADKKFDFTDYSLNEIVRSTMDRALKIIRAAGGSVTEAEVTVPRQSPKAPKLEQWSMGVPQRMVPGADAAWNWQGPWEAKKGALEFRTQAEGRVATRAGAEGTLTFEGTGVVLVGPHSPAGGRADVWVDGKKAGMIDFYIVPRTTDDSLWHVYGLKPGRHTVRLVTRDDADPRSTGRECFVLGALTYGPERK